ncbi:MAG: IS5 family transposase, partial [Parachlamydiaceae bacterium]
RRVATMELPTLPLSKGGTIVLDSTGMKVTGEGEWKVKIHGRGKPRKWIKVHIGIDLENQKIGAEIVTDSSIGDSKMTKPLLDQVQGKIKKVIADGGYDRSEARGEIRKKKAQALIPPPKNAKYRGLKNERVKAILEIHGLGNSKEGRSLWGKLTGYHRRVLIEAAISRLKRLFGDRFYSKSLERQLVENRLRCLLINRMCHG